MTDVKNRGIQLSLVLDTCQMLNRKGTRWDLEGGENQHQGLWLVFILFSLQVVL